MSVGGGQGPVLVVLQVLFPPGGSLLVVSLKDTGQIAARGRARRGWHPNANLVSLQVCANQGTGEHREAESWLSCQVAARHDQALLPGPLWPLPLLLTSCACPGTRYCPREREHTSSRGDGRLGNQQWLQSGQTPPEIIGPKWTPL